MSQRQPGSSPNEILAVDGISVTMSGRHVLRQVSFTIDSGEFTGLIGSNGAGKTTLFRVILGLTAPTEGSHIGGGPTPIPAESAGGLRPPEDPARCGYAAAGAGSGRTRLGRASFRDPFPSRQRRKLIDEMLDAVDASSFGDARVGHLSGGEQQRVMIAHALIGRPRLLLLDEPLANLDLRSEQEVVTLLARIATEQGIAVLLSAHEMNPLLPVMDRIVYLADGRAASGTTAEVVRSETLTKLYGHHVDVIQVHNRILVVAQPGDGRHGSGHESGEAGDTVHVVDLV